MVWKIQLNFGILKCCQMMKIDHWTEHKDKAMLFAEYTSACGLSNKIDGTKDVMIKE